MPLFNIIEHYENQDHIESWCRRSYFNGKGRLEHRKLLDVCKVIGFLEGVESFDTIDSFSEYIQSNLSKNAITDTELTNQFKGYIFELFCETFLNYFSTISVHVRAKDTVETYVTKSVCVPPSEYQDYGVDLLCRVSQRDGVSKNGVIQVKFRTGKDFNLQSSIIDKLGFQGVRCGFIEPLTPDNPKDKTLILFTNLRYDEYKRTFEGNIGFENLLIIDGHTIDELIATKDFWACLKNKLNKIMCYA